MDKIKTGKLIKEARTKKNYTQSELGDLLGVSNKAVSRWENGDSFPDVGVLESLSSILDIKIQDIVTGESESNNEEAITEVVRYAKLQQREKNRKLFGYVLVVFALVCCMIAGYSGLGSSAMLFANDSGAIYVIMMTLTMLLAVYGCASQDEGNSPSDNIVSKRLCFVSMLTLVWSALVMWLFIILISKGISPFGMELASVGPFINRQLIIIFIINIGIIVAELYRNGKGAANIHWGCMVSISAIYMTIFYGDMLHRLTTVGTVFRILSIRTLIVIGELSGSLLLIKCLNRKKQLAKKAGSL